MHYFCLLPPGRIPNVPATFSFKGHSLSMGTPVIKHHEAAHFKTQFDHAQFITKPSFSMRAHNETPIVEACRTSIPITSNSSEPANIAPQEPLTAS